VAGSAGTSDPSGTFTSPVTRGPGLPGLGVVPGGTATVVGAAGAAVAGLLFAVALTRARRRQRARPDGSVRPDGGVRHHRP
jgi:hypothetical protein